MKRTLLALVLSPALSAVAQPTTIIVDSGELLTESDLLAGIFSGQPFSLGTDTTFEVNDGGAVDRLAGIPLGGGMRTAFDWQFSALNLNAGALLRGDMFVGPGDNRPNSISNVFLNVRDGAVVEGGVWVSGESVVHITGGMVQGDLFAFGATRVEIDGGVIGLPSSSNSPVLVAEGMVRITGGEIVADQFSATETSTLDVSDGSITNLIAKGQTTVSGGAIQSATIVGTGQVSGGQHGSFLVQGIGAALRIDNGTFNSVSGGPFATMIVAGGTIDQLVARPTGPPGNVGNISVSGGDIGVLRMLPGSSPVSVSGGEIDQVLMSGNSSLSLSGGVVDVLSASSGSNVHLFVDALLLDGLSIELELGQSIQIDDRSGVLLEATLADGSFFDVWLGDDLNSLGNIFSGATLNVTRVPSPATLLILGMTPLVVTRRKR